MQVVCASIRTKLGVNLPLARVQASLAAVCQSGEATLDAAFIGTTLFLFLGLSAQLQHLLNFCTTRENSLKLLVLEPKLENCVLTYGNNSP